jgi:hypothetical protein
MCLAQDHTSVKKGWPLNLTREGRYFQAASLPSRGSVARVLHLTIVPLVSHSSLAALLLALVALRAVGAGTIRP